MNQNQKIKTSVKVKDLKKIHGNFGFHHKHNENVKVSEHNVHPDRHYLVTTHGIYRTKDTNVKFANFDVSIRNGLVSQASLNGYRVTTFYNRGTYNFVVSGDFQVVNLGKHKITINTTQLEPNAYTTLHMNGKGMTVAAGTCVLKLTGVNVTFSRDVLLHKTDNIVGVTVYGKKMRAGIGHFVHRFEEEFSVHAMVQNISVYLPYINLIEGHEQIVIHHLKYKPALKLLEKFSVHDDDMEFLF